MTDMHSRKKINQILLKFPFLINGYRSSVRLVNNFVRQKNVAMFHTGRCGSTVLAMMMNAHTDICWGNEIFHRYMNNQKDSTLDSKSFVRREIEWSSSSSISKIYGFETKYLPEQHLSPRCVDMELSEYIDLLYGFQVHKFIILHRRNYLRHLVSGEVGRKKKSWHVVNKSVMPTSINIDISSVTIGRREVNTPLLEAFHFRDEQYNKLKKLLSAKDVLLLSYEDDILTDPRIAYEKICDFFGVQSQKPDVRLSRTNPFTLQEMIENFEDVEMVLSGTKYEWMLEC